MKNTHSGAMRFGFEPCLVLQCIATMSFDGYDGSIRHHMPNAVVGAARRLEAQMAKGEVGLCSACS